MNPKFKILSDIKDIGTIASGRGVYIRRYLERTYGRGRWRKMKGIATVELADGTICEARACGSSAPGRGTAEPDGRRADNVPFGQLALCRAYAPSGSSVRRGSITKTGNARLRRVLIEAAWHYRHMPTPGATVQRRRQGQPLSICRIADKAQRRLHLRYRRLLGRGKSKQQTATALGRELIGFVWAIARELEGAPRDRRAA